MDFNTIAIILGTAVFVLPVVYMLGYVRHEKQQQGWVNNARKGFNMERAALIELHQKDLAACHAAAMRQAEAVDLLTNNCKDFEDRWNYADTYRKAIVNYLVVNHLWNFDKHENDPMLMMAEIIKWETKVALDPAVSKAAKNLHTRGVRKGAKAGREQMRKLMQKAIDNQALTIESYRNERDIANNRRMRFTRAVTNVLNDKIALPGVRRSIVQSIVQEHDRLRSVAQKQGE